MLMLIMKNLDAPRTGNTIPPKSTRNNFTAFDWRSSSNPNKSDHKKNANADSLQTFFHIKFQLYKRAIINQLVIHKHNGKKYIRLQVQNYLVRNVHLTILYLQ